MKRVLQKLEELPFEFDADRERLSWFLASLDSIELDDKAWADIDTIITQKWKELTWFDSDIFFSPRKLLHAIARLDIFWTLITHEEFYELYETLENYVLHKEHVLKDKERIEQTYSITLQKIDTLTERNHIVATPLSEVMYVASIPVIRKLISKYPPTFINNVWLEKVVLASSFSKKHAGEDCIYLGWFETNVDNNIYLSAPSLYKSFDHELYHQAMQHYHDGAERGNLRSNDDVFYQAQHSNKKTQWFAVNYGRENISEDQATMAEYMIRDYASIKHRAQTDSILKKKMKLVLDAFHKLSEGLINEERFENL